MSGLPAKDDPNTGLTVSGPQESLEEFLRSAAATPHTWAVERQWVREDGSHSARVAWPHRPSFADVGPIVVLVQQARGLGLTISDTQVVETQQ